jgi:hypothetical protein
MAFAGLLDWHWQDVLASGEAFDRAQALNITYAYLAGLFPREFAPVAPSEIGS